MRKWTVIVLLAIVLACLLALPALAPATPSATGTVVAQASVPDPGSGAIDFEKTAQLAAVIWLLTGVLTRVAAKWDSQLISLGLAVLLGAAAILTHYLTGPPVGVALELVLALYGGNLAHDKISKPLGDALGLSAGDV